MLTEDCINSNEEKEKAINDEYKIWKKNTPFLYDLIVTHVLEWPSLTVQWLPDVERPVDKDYIVQRLLLGTHTSNSEPNYLCIARIQLPLPDINDESYDGGNGESGGYGGAESKISIIQKINHDYEVNRARYMPSNPDIFATRTISGPVYIFDRVKHPSFPDPNSGCNPDIRLIGHTREGYGTSWHPNKPGILLTSSEDHTVCLWDLSGCTKENRTLNPTTVYTGHSSWVQDVAWSWLLETIFGSVGDDGKLMIWDTRMDSTDTPAYTVGVQLQEVTCLDFSPSNENILAVGGIDGKISLWDLRNLSADLHTLDNGEKEVHQLSFSPTNETILASSSGDRTLSIWDLSKIGDEQTAEDMEDGPPELLFVHKGHTSKVVDFSWNKNDPWVMCSVAEDNICQVWQMTSSIYSLPSDVPENVLS